MKKAAYLSILCLVTGTGFVAGARYGKHARVKSTVQEVHNLLYYVDPMHPAYKSDKPGTAPDCGMKLEPVYTDDESSQSNMAEQVSALPRGFVQVNTAKQQLFGIRVSSVQKSSSTQKLRLFGRVVPEESRVYKVNAGTEGFIQEVSAITTGTQVRKNQLLATFSAPNATMTIQNFLLNLGAEDRFKKSAAQGTVEGQNLPATASNLQQRISQLQDLGMSTLQMDEIRNSRQLPEAIKIVAPASGFVLERNVSPGQKFERGAEWFRIANLDRIWIEAYVHENEAQYLRPGTSAVISLPSEHKALAARVSNVLPQIDDSTKGLKIRLEADNPGYILRPDMLVDVEVSFVVPSSLSIPTEAVLDTGASHIVFVEREPGIFEPRTIETGWRFGDQIQVVKGLRANERVVTSGNFLINSESRLRERAPEIAVPDRQSAESEHELQITDYAPNQTKKNARESSPLLQNSSKQIREGRTSPEGNRQSPDAVPNSPGYGGHRG